MKGIRNCAYISLDVVHTCSKFNGGLTETKAGMSHYIPKNKLEQLERLRSEDIPPPHDYPYYWAILDPKSKEDKVKVTNLKNLQTFRILKHTLHTTHLLTLLEKMCKYEMDPMSIVEDKERTRFCPQTDRRTRWNQYTPHSTSLKRGVYQL